MGPVALERLVGALADIEGEAQVRADDVYRQLQSRPGDGSDADSIAEGAHEAGVAHLAELKSLKQSITNLLAAGLFHLFKQQRAWYIENAKRRGTAVQLRDLSRWPKVAELELVANTVKHAEGGASGKLREIRPDLFAYVIAIAMPLPVRVEAPLAGEGLYVRGDDIRTYADSIINL